MSLGSILMFQQELLQQRSLGQFDLIDLYFRLPAHIPDLSYLSTLAQLNPFLNSVHFIASWSDDFDRAAQKTAFVWPNSERRVGFSYSGSTLCIQKLFRRTNKVFPLQSPEMVRDSAKRFLSAHQPLNHLPIAVHLKNNSTDPLSNADQEEWMAFFADCQKASYPVFFILIGNEPCDPGFRKLTNCVMTRENGGALALDLALIQASRLFMGMSSGPCNLAILSDLPYIIFKDPDHHRSEMEKELNEQGQFVFANRLQHFIRAKDRTDHLMEYFKTVYNEINKDGERI